MLTSFKHKHLFQVGPNVNRRKVGRVLKTQGKGTRRFLFNLPATDAHQHHPVGEVSTFQLFNIKN